MSVWRPEFEAALAVFAAISDEMAAHGAQRPILVGGAAVEMYTGSAMVTGDFDIVTGRHDLIDTLFREHGFVPPHPGGRGWVHPELALGFEVVGGSLMDGRADRDRLRLIRLADSETAPALVAIPVEDLIADRLGQYASGSARAMLGQAKALFALYNQLDLAYLEKRIRDETHGDHGIEILEGP
jgi:hypothetical protein